MFSGLVTLESNHESPPTVPELIIEIPNHHSFRQIQFRYDSWNIRDLLRFKYHHATELHKTTVHTRWQDTRFPDFNLDQSRHALCNYLLLVQSLFWYIICFHGCFHLHLVETQLFQRHSFQGLSLFLLLMRNQNVLCRNCTVHFGFESYGLQSTGMSGVLKLCQDLALIST